jgi:hypothetical protein
MRLWQTTAVTRRVGKLASHFNQSSSNGKKVSGCIMIGIPRALSFDRVRGEGGSRLSIGWRKGGDMQIGVQATDAISKAALAKIAKLLADACKPNTATSPAVGVPAEYRVFKALV